MSFRDAGGKVIEGVAAGLYEGGTIVMAQSQVLVPVEFGTLKRSGRVEEPEVEGDSVTVTVGYGYGTDYEARAGEENGDGHGYGYWVHERVIVETYDGRPARNAGKPVRHKPPTQAKFLSDPAEAFAPAFPSVVQAAIRERTGN